MGILGSGSAAMAGRVGKVRCIADRAHAHLLLVNTGNHINKAAD
jgi:hypothetical protein